MPSLSWDRHEIPGIRYVFVRFSTISTIFVRFVHFGIQITQCFRDEIPGIRYVFVRFSASFVRFVHFGVHYVMLRFSTIFYDFLRFVHFGVQITHCFRDQIPEIRYAFVRFSAIFVRFVHFGVHHVMFGN